MMLHAPRSRHIDVLHKHKVGATHMVPSSQTQSVHYTPSQERLNFLRHHALGKRHHILGSGEEGMVFTKSSGIKGGTLDESTQSTLLDSSNPSFGSHPSPQHDVTTHIAEHVADRNHVRRIEGAQIRAIRAANLARNDKNDELTDQQVSNATVLGKRVFLMTPEERRAWKAQYGDHTLFSMMTNQVREDEKNRNFNHARKKGGVLTYGLFK